MIRVCERYVIVRIELSGIFAFVLLQSLLYLFFRKYDVSKYLELDTDY